MFHFIKRNAGLFFFAAILIPAAAHSAGFDNMYVIGDSLSDQGNLFAATQQSTGNGIPASDHYYQGRFSNGENYAGILAKKIGLPLTPSILGGNNYAYGGTRTDYNRVEADVTKPFPVSLLGQRGVFPEDAFPWTVNSQRMALAARNVSDPDGLYVVFSGANDLADLTTMMAIHAADPRFPEVAPGDIITKIVQGINDAIATAVAAGARDVLVPNMPNLGVVPGVTRSGPQVSALATLLSKQYNAALGAMLATWSGRVNIIPFDLYSLVSNVAANPIAYGFSNASSACYSGFVEPAGPADTVCATPETYAFWDSEHPTTAFHAFLAERMRGAMMLDIFDDLTQRLNALDLPYGVMNALHMKLDGAKRRLTDSKTVNDGAAAAKLHAFILSVKAGLGKNILSEPDALGLIDRAEKIISLLGDNKL